MKIQVLAAIAAFVLTGCMSIPKIKESQMLTTNQESNYIHSENWWLLKNDHILSSLIEEILSGNSQIKISKLNIEKTIIALDSVKNINFAPVVVQGGWERLNIIDTNVNTELPIVKIQHSNNIKMGQLSLQSGYVFDVWNKFESLTKQAEYSKIGAELQEQWVSFSISTMVSDLYGKYLLLSKERALLEEKLKISKEIVNFQKSLYSNGRDSKSSIQISENSVYSISQKISEINSAQLGIKNALYALNGTSHSEKIESLLENINGKTFLMDISLPANIDSDLVSQRADIRYYLAIIDSQRENLNSLKADFYPRFSIGGALEFHDISLAGLLTANSSLFKFGPSLYFPLFNQKEIKRNYSLAGIDLNIFIENYNQSLIKAFKEVNSNLEDFRSAHKNLELEKKKYFNIKAKHIEEAQLYSLGKISKYNLILSENQLLDSHLVLIQSEYDLYSKQIRLISSLGGYYARSNER